MHTGPRSTAPSGVIAIEVLSARAAIGTLRTWLPSNVTTAMPTASPLAVAPNLTWRNVAAPAPRTVPGGGAVTIVMSVPVNVTLLIVIAAAPELPSDTIAVRGSPTRVVGIVAGLGVTSRFESMPLHDRGTLTV